MKNKTWGILIAGMLAFQLLVGLLFRAQEGGCMVNIYQNGICIASVDLRTVEEPYSFDVIDGAGHRNTVAVERGRIRVSEANCPDQVCVDMGWLSGSAKPIVCLPAKLTIQLERWAEADKLEVDGVAG